MGEPFAPPAVNETEIEVVLNAVALSEVGGSGGASVMFNQAEPSHTCTFLVSVRNTSWPVNGDGTAELLFADVVTVTPEKDVPSFAWVMDPSGTVWLSDVPSRTHLLPLYTQILPPALNDWLTEGELGKSSAITTNSQFPYHP